MYLFRQNFLNMNNNSTTKPHISFWTLKCLKQAIMARLSYAYFIRSVGLGLFFGVLQGLLISFFIEHNSSGFYIKTEFLSSLIPWLTAIAVGGFVLGLIGQLKVEKLMENIVGFYDIDSIPFLDEKNLVMLNAIKEHPQFKAYFESLAKQGRSITTVEAEMLISAYLSDSL